MASSRRSSRLAVSNSTALATDCGVTPLKRKRSKTEPYVLPNLPSARSPDAERLTANLANDDDVQTPNRKNRQSTPSTKDQEDVLKHEKSLRRRNQSKKVADEDGDVQTSQPRKKRQPKPEPVYIIPDVERKVTTFKGRLGYACLNTVLRNKRPASESVFCSRTCRLDSITKNGIEWVKDLGKRNVEDLLIMIQWNEDNHIRFLRLSSEMFPFASHEKHGYSLDYCDTLLAQVGLLANKYGHRLTTHPGQYTQLGSPKPAVIKSAIRELSYHCEMLDKMGIGVDGVMVVHGGGMYEDKAATLGRVKRTITELLPPNVRARLVLENDENVQLCYSAEDLLPLCEALDVPLVFGGFKPDYHHDALNPSSIPPRAIIQRANAIFARRGITPKQHLSEVRPGASTLMERRAHADRCESLPQDLPDNMASLRPPAENQTKQTKGRKSTKRLRLRAKAEREREDADKEGVMTLVDSSDTKAINETSAASE
ncbi:hypothetical protein H0H87_004110 [Tephrocybe sp. NHM501043]|nr:hypothetical protein H0H87_004110 [Tephrocybe sp. NHM501043]